MMQEDAIQNAHATLARSLQTMNCRCTPERRAILDAACSMDAPFSIADIAAQMASHGFKVSRATLYNTIRLLVDLRLIVCLRMQNCTRYEAVDPKRTRCRQVCTLCGRTMEVSAPAELGKLPGAKTRRFRPTAYALYVFGMCASCQRRAGQDTNINKKHTRSAGTEKEKQGNI